MTTYTQERRAELANTPPTAGSLKPGQIYLELADPMKLWVGVPTTLNASQQKLFLDASASITGVTAGNGLTGGGTSGAITLALNTPVSVSNGGTGATTPSAALASLGGISGNQTITVSGDAGGTGTTAVPLTVTGLQGRAVASTTPLANQALAWSGTNWTPTTIAATTVMADAPPASPQQGQGWWNSSDAAAGGQLYLWYNDGTSSQWVPATNPPSTLPLPLAIASGGTNATTAPAALTNLGAAPLASPVFTGTPSLPAGAIAVTAAAGDADTSLATTAFVAAAVAPALNDVGRSLVHNPIFNVAQRGAGPFTTTASYTLDRWKLDFALDTISVQQLANDDTHRAQIGDEAANNLMYVIVTGNAGASAFSIVSQFIENVRRLAGKTVTVSFWAYATAGTPKIGVAAGQSFGTGGSPSAQVNINGTSVTLNTTATRYSVTFTFPSSAGKTLGTNGDSYSRLVLFFSSGSTNNTFAGGIGVQSANFLLWGVQLEIGSAATPLEKPDPQQDLAKCQRFYQLVNASVRGVAGATGGFFDTAVSWVTMRAQPTITLNAAGSASNASSVILLPNSANGGRFEAQAGVSGDSYALNYSYALSADL